MGFFDSGKKDFNTGRRVPDIKPTASSIEREQKQWGFNVAKQQKEEAARREKERQDAAWRQRNGR